MDWLLFLIIFSVGGAIGSALSVYLTNQRWIENAEFDDSGIQIGRYMYKVTRYTHDQWNQLSDDRRKLPGQ